MFAALDTVPKPANVGDQPTDDRDVKREGKLCAIDVVTPDARDVNLFVEGPTRIGPAGSIAAA